MRIHGCKRRRYELQIESNFIRSFEPTNLHQNIEPYPPSPLFPGHCATPYTFVLPPLTQRQIEPPPPPQPRPTRIAASEATTDGRTPLQTDPTLSPISTLLRSGRGRSGGGGSSLSGPLSSPPGVGKSWHMLLSSCLWCTSACSASRLSNYNLLKCCWKLGK